MNVTDIRTSNRALIIQKNGQKLPGTITHAINNCTHVTIKYDTPYKLRQITCPMEHKEIKAEFMKQWMSRNGRENATKWTDDVTSTDETMQSPFVQDTRYGRTLREHVHSGKNISSEKNCVPATFKPVLECMRFKKTAQGMGRRINEKDYGDTKSLHTDAQWLSAVKSKRPGSAPGLSNLTYAEIQCSSEHTQLLLGRLCNLTITTGICPTAWHNDCYYLIPKKTTDSRLIKQRPLTLQETLRKITVSIRRRKMVKVWEKFGLIDDDQYAFVNGGNTVEPAMLKRQVVEDSMFYRKNLAICEQDMSAAFDTISTFIKEMALRRFGVPYELIDYFLEFDRNNVKVVRTIFGDSKEFSVERGCCPQGGDFSAYLYICCQDIKDEITNKFAMQPYLYNN
jgi:hypothetical protein